MIIIPMAGLSRRFAACGFNQPKYMLELHGTSLFEHSVNSFRSYFNQEQILFVIRQGPEVEEFVTRSCSELGIANHSLVQLGHDTEGQAHTVSLGLNTIGVADDEPITIFNIDTFRPGYIKPSFMDACDGYLEVFEGEGESWSFARLEPGSENKVIETTEKRRISNLCSTGIYYFASAGLFREAYRDCEQHSVQSLDAGERYVAPLYNYLIAAGYDIRADIIDRGEVIFCGVPEEYYELAESPRFWAD